MTIPSPDVKRLYLIWYCKDFWSHSAFAPWDPFPVVQEEEEEEEEAREGFLADPGGWDTRRGSRLHEGSGRAGP